MAHTDPRQVGAVLERLVAFDTVSAHSNLALYDYVTSYLVALDIPVRTFPDASGAKCAMLATVCGPGDIGRATRPTSGSAVMNCPMPVR